MNSRATIFGIASVLSVASMVFMGIYTGYVVFWATFFAYITFYILDDTKSIVGQKNG